MAVAMDNKTISNLFYEQFRKETQKANINSFDYQFSDRWLE